MYSGVGAGALCHVTLWYLLPASRIIAERDTDTGCFETTFCVASRQATLIEDCFVREDTAHASPVHL